MKVLKEAVEVSEEGLEALLGEKVTLFCANYIYAGKLIGVNEKCVKLADPFIVYETGDFSEKEFKDAQSLGKKPWYVQCAAIESFGQLK